MNSAAEMKVRDKVATVPLKLEFSDPSFEMPRSRRKKVMPGEVCRDEAVTDPEKNFKVNFFYPVYNTCLLQMESRFSDFLTTARRFAVLQPRYFEDEDAE